MLLTAKYLSELLVYDHLTGALSWRSSGKPAGSNEKGYLRLGLDGKRQYAHRVIWCMVTGEWPDHMIDHVDMNRSNNRFDNLRKASRSENLRNTVAYRSNKTGVKGACKRGNKYRAQISIYGRTKYVGSFSSLEEAQAAYLRAAMRVAPEFARAS